MAIAARLTARQRWILAAASLGAGLAFLDETAVVTALPQIQRDFLASSAEVQWVVGAYLLAFASLMALAGRLADLHGRRRMFLAGAVVLGVASAICAAAPSEEVLILARALEGAGAAMLVPLAMANATMAVPDAFRGRAVGIVSTGATVFLAAGPLVGGGLVEVVGWRWIFLVNLPAVAAVVAIAVRTFPETRAPQPQPLDVAGAALLVSGLGCLIATLLNLQDWGAVSPVTLAMLAVAVALLAAFVAAERRSDHPLVELALLRVPAVAGLLAALFAIQFSILGITVYATLYLQHVLGYSPFVAGLLLLPTVAAAPLLAASSGRLADRVGARWPTAAAMALAGVALVAVALVAHREDVLLLLPAFVAFGVARPVATVAGTAGVVAITPREARGVSTALVNQARQLGAVLSVAVLGAVLTGVEIGQRQRLLADVDRSLPHASREALDGVLAGSAAGDRLLAHLPPAARAQARRTAEHVFTSGFEVAMAVTAGLAAAAAILALALVRRVPSTR